MGCEYRILVFVVGHSAEYEPQCRGSWWWSRWHSVRDGSILGSSFPTLDEAKTACLQHAFPLRSVGQKPAPSKVILFDPYDPE